MRTARLSREQRAEAAYPNFDWAAYYVALSREASIAAAKLGGNHRTRLGAKDNEKKK